MHAAREARPNLEHARLETEISNYAEHFFAASVASKRKSGAKRPDILHIWVRFNVKRELRERKDNLSAQTADNQWK